MSAARPPQAPGATARGIARVLGALWALSAATPPAGSAQALSGAVSGWDVHRLVSYRSQTYAQRGASIGLRGAVRVWRLRVAAGLLRGTLNASSGVPNAEVRLRSEAVSLGFSLTDAISVGANREVRQFTSEAGATAWVLQGVEGRFEPDLGLAGLRGIAEVALLSSSRVRDGPGFSTAFRTVMGIGLRPGPVPLSLRVSYRFERFDLDRGATDRTLVRYEEFRGAVVELVFPARQ